MTLIIRRGGCVLMAVDLLYCDKLELHSKVPPIINIDRESTMENKIYGIQQMEEK